MHDHVVNTRKLDGCFVEGDNGQIDNTHNEQRCYDGRCVPCRSSEPSIWRRLQPQATRMMVLVFRCFASGFVVGFVTQACQVG